MLSRRIWRLTFFAALVTIRDGFASGAYAQVSKRTYRPTLSKKEREDFWNLWVDCFGPKCCVCGCTIKLSEAEIEHMGLGWSKRVKSGVAPTKENFKKWCAWACPECNRPNKTKKSRRQTTPLKPCLNRLSKVTKVKIPVSITCGDENGSDDSWILFLKRRQKKARAAGKLTARNPN